MGTCILIDCSIRNEKAMQILLKGFSSYMIYMVWCVFHCFISISTHHYLGLHLLGERSEPPQRPHILSIWGSLGLLTPPRAALPLQKTYKSLETSIIKLYKAIWTHTKLKTVAKGEAFNCKH